MTNHTDSSKEIEIPKDFALLLLNKAFAYSTNRKPELVSHIRQEDFIAGAEWAYRHLHPSPSGWIEIKPGCEMPEIDEDVLWRRENGNYFVSCRDKDDYDWWNDILRFDERIEGSKCTHWSIITPPAESVTA
jgi:hypothetical protein